ncbi:MAG TPA: PASTA domain-containing protein [Gaiellaceae bacterium]|nr:PASTA domain-containing protein [Gaiellaceae bacterium]
MKRVKVACTVVVAVGIAVALSGCGPVPAGLYAGGYSVGQAAALSADGTTALVAAPGVTKNRGVVYVFHGSSAGSWVSSSTPAATLTCKGVGAAQTEGSVALSADGTTAFVGAPGYRDGVGAVCVFHVPNEDAWASSSTPTATLTVGHGKGFMGWAVAGSSDGTTLVAGAPLYLSGAGGAYVFHVSSEDGWVSSSTPAATLSNAGESRTDLFVGSAVAISGDGASALLSDSRSRSGEGRAYVFHVASEAAWTSSSAPTAILSNASGAAHDALGRSLAFSGDGTTAFLGAPGVKGGRGAVDVFRAAGEGAWASSSTPAATLTNASGSRHDLLGHGVAVSADGTTAVVTAPGVKRKAGASYVFHVTDEGAWTSSAAPNATLTDSTGGRNGRLGVGLASSADGATVLVGAPGIDWNTGAADVFHVSDASSWLTSSTPAATLTNSALPHLDCVVPRLVGLRLAPARVALKDANCRLGKVTEVRSRAKKGRIVSQSPAPGSHLAPRSKVNVKVGN